MHDHAAIQSNIGMTVLRLFPRTIQRGAGAPVPRHGCRCPQNKLRVQGTVSRLRSSCGATPPDRSCGSAGDAVCGPIVCPSMVLPAAAALENDLAVMEGFQLRTMPDADHREFRAPWPAAPSVFPGSRDRARTSPRRARRCRARAGGCAQTPAAASLRPTTSGPRAPPPLAGRRAAQTDLLRSALRDLVQLALFGRLGIGCRPPQVPIGT